MRVREKTGARVTVSMKVESEWDRGVKGRKSEQTESGRESGRERDSESEFGSERRSGHESETKWE